MLKYGIAGFLNLLCVICFVSYKFLGVETDGMMMSVIFYGIQSVLSVIVIIGVEISEKLDKIKGDGKSN